MPQWCSDKVIIRRDSVANWGFKYEYQNKPVHEATTILCSDCGIRLDGRYTTIICRLMDAGLLPPTFKMRCCSCFFISNYKDSRECPVCGDFLEADYQDGEIHIFCVSGCIEDYFEPTEADSKYLKEYIYGDDLVNDALVECGGIINDSDRAYLKWLLDLQ